MLSEHEHDELLSKVDHSIGYFIVDLGYSTGIRLEHLKASKYILILVSVVSFSLCQC